jgi:hypothetical protein
MESHYASQHEATFADTNTKWRTCRISRIYIFDDDILRRFYQHKSIKCNDGLVVISTKTDDWLRNWVGLLLVNPGN